MDDLELKKRPVSKPLANQDEANYTRHCKERNTQALTSDRAVWIVFFSLLVDLLAFTVILPLFPSLLEFYDNNKQDRLYHSIMEQVNKFRTLLGMPDNERFNVVLFGGRTTCI